VEKRINGEVSWKAFTAAILSARALSLGNLIALVVVEGLVVECARQ